MNVGEKVPNFSILSGRGSLCHYADLRDKPLVLYFYPRDNTPGCTEEACSFRDSWHDLRPICHVLGVSRDSAESHRKFAEKYNLSFDLLADTDESLCQLFDVMREKNMYGKKVRGIERTTFLINTDATIVHVWRKVKVAGHVAAVAAAVKSLVTA